MTESTEYNQKAAAAVPPASHDDLPPLARDPAFAGFTTAQFFGAFNDNLFKQLVLLLALEVTRREQASFDYQAVASFLFALPWLLFSGVAGFLSDRYSKRLIAVTCKAAEIGIVLLGLLAFLAQSLPALLAVLFLMGVHSTFFGPAKYGILPEMLRRRDLPRANGFIQMTTFFAIIFGIALAGVLKDQFSGRLWIGSLFCLGFAVIGTAAALLMRPTPRANPHLGFGFDTILGGREVWQALRADRSLLLALLVSSLFWFLGGVVQPTVNAVGKGQLGLNDAHTSLLLVGVAVGIAVGCFASGRLAHGTVDFRLVFWGGWGIFASLLALPAVCYLPFPVAAFALTLILLGISSGVFVIPIQVFLQTHAPTAQKGRIIAAMNFCNFVGIALAGGYYGLVTFGLKAFGGQPALVFALSALLFLPVNLWYRPQSEQL